MILLEICFEAVVDVVDDAVDLTIGIRESFSLVGDFESLLEVVFLHSFLLSGSVSSVVVDGVELNFAEEVELTASVEECVVDVREFACFAEAISGFGIFFFFVLQETEEEVNSLISFVMWGMTCTVWPRYSPRRSLLRTFQ